MPHAYCDREECCYRSLGGWCQLGHPSWSQAGNLSEINCQLIKAFRQDELGPSQPLY